MLDIRTPTVVNLRGPPLGKAKQRIACVRFQGVAYMVQHPLRSPNVPAIKLLHDVAADVIIVSRNNLDEFAWCIVNDTLNIMQLDVRSSVAQAAGKTVEVQRKPIGGGEERHECVEMENIAETTAVVLGKSAEPQSGRQAVGYGAHFVVESRAISGGVRLDGAP